MPWKVKTFMLVDREPEEEIIYQDKHEAQDDADQAMYLQPGEVLAEVVECDDEGNEV